MLSPNVLGRQASQNVIKVMKTLLNRKLFSGHCGQIVAVLAVTFFALSLAKTMKGEGQQVWRFNFPPGSRYTIGFHDGLDDVALSMKQNGDAKLQVIAYATADELKFKGGFRSAQQLAEIRAQDIRDYLVTRHGIDPSRITVMGEVSSDNAHMAVLTLQE